MTKEEETLRKKIWANNNIERVRESHRKSYQKNREARLASKKIRDKLPESIENRRIKERQYMAELPDFKVKNMLIHQFGVKDIKSKDIPQELVELKRKQLKLYRNAKEINNAANS
jgi:hypothetical protein